MLADVLRWPEWWRGVEAVEELAGGDERRVASRYRVRWRSRLPYAVTFDFTVEEVDRPRTMAGRAAGDLEGSGRWRLFEDDGITAVVYEWDVAVGRPWLGLLRPVARRNHDVVMRWGGEGLARRAGARLLGRG